MATGVGLISYWEMEEADGQDRVDSHGSNTMSNIGNVLQTTGHINYGALTNHDGVDYLKIANAAQTGLDFTGSFSLQSWWAYGIFNWRSCFYWRANHVGVYYRQNGSPAYRPLFVTYGSGPSAHTLVADTNMPGGFNHYVFTYDSTTKEKIIYLNNVVDGQATASHSNALNNSGNDVHLLTNLDSYTARASLDEVGVWNKCLTPAEVDWLYNGGTGRTYSEVAADLGTIDGEATMKIINGQVRIRR